LHASEGTRFLSVSSALHSSPPKVAIRNPQKLIDGSASSFSNTTRPLSGSLKKVRSDLPLVAKEAKKVKIIQINPSSQPSLILYESVFTRLMRGVQEINHDAYPKINEFLEDFSQIVVGRIKSTYRVIKVTVGTTIFFVTVTAVGKDLYLSQFSYPPIDPSS